MLIDVYLCSLFFADSSLLPELCFIMYKLVTFPFSIWPFSSLLNHCLEIFNCPSQFNEFTLYLTTCDCVFKLDIYFSNRALSFNDFVHSLSAFY